MSPRRTRRGTIRESVCDVSIVNNSSKSAIKKLKGTKAINKSLSTKSSEEDNSANFTEVINFIDSNASLNFVNETSRNTRNHRRKNIENQDNNTSVIEQPTTKTRSRKNNLKTPNTKKQSKSNKLETIDISSLISEDESIDLKNKNDNKLAISVVDSLISEDDETYERKLRKNIRSNVSENLSKSKKKKRLSNQNLSRSRKKIQLNNQNECRTPEKSLIQIESNNAKSSVEVTPKSSPLNVSLTPNRSTKTPKRSPVNLGSPKTHSRNSIKTLNVPRKLPIAEPSPVSEKSSDSLQLLNTSNIKNILVPQSNLKSPLNKKLSVTPKLQVSKSPKSKSTNKLSKKKLSKMDSLKQDESSSLKELEKPVISKSPEKSKKSSKINASLNSAETDKIKSKTLQPQTSILPVVSLEHLSTNSSIANESQVIFSMDSTTLSKAVTPAKSKRLSMNLSKSKTSKSLLSKSVKEVSILKSKKSSKIVLPLSSKKMPKIVLISKSKRSSKSSRSLSPSKIKKALNTSKVLKKESVSLKLLNRKSFPGNNAIINNSLISPRVIINKLSAPELKNSILNMKKNRSLINSVPSDLNTNKNTLASAKSQNLLSSKNSVIASSTPAKSENMQITLSKNISLNSKNLSFRGHTPCDNLEKNLLNLKPTNTSTPREKLKRTLTVTMNKNNLTSKQQNGNVFNDSYVSKPKVIKRLNNQSVNVNLQLLEDESEPYMNDTSLIHMSEVFNSDNSHNDNTFEVDKSNLDTLSRGKSVRNSSNKSNNDTFEIKDKSEILVKDSTYELEYPKTPGLQNKINKGTVDEVNKNEDQESKKLCRVHFASPNLENQVRSSGINRISTPGHAIHSKRTPVQISKIKTRNQFLPDKEKRTSVVPTSLTKVNGNRSANKRNSNALSNATLTSRKSIHEMQMNSVNRLSRPKSIVDSTKKTGLKTPVPTKIPNFAEIHQKNFAKMESLVDLKKRIEKRHVTINTATSSTKKDKPLGYNINRTVPENGAYNRFGFKMRKNDAIDIVSKKAFSGTDSREKKRETARTALKGVRMNRRFELQMKARSQNS